MDLTAAYSDHDIILETFYLQLSDFVPGLVSFHFSAVVAEYQGMRWTVEISEYNLGPIID